MTAHQEVNTLKSEWKSVMNIVSQLKALVDRAHEKCKNRGAKALPEGLADPFAQLEGCVPMLSASVHVHS